jgi:hypothetical protein
MPFAADLLMHEAYYLSLNVKCSVCRLKVDVRGLDQWR